MPKMLEAALRYQAKGYSVIPVKPDAKDEKKPFVKWGHLQKRQATESEIHNWWGKWPNANIGIVTGIVSGVSVVDIDEYEGVQAIQDFLPENTPIPTAVTSSGGQHLYFETPDPPLGNNVRLIPGCDFRGEGGYVVVPPSRNGETSYQWLPKASIFEIAPPPLPSSYLVFINSLALGGYKGGQKSKNDERNKSLQTVTSLLTSRDVTRPCFT
jgi:hypothetical protein